jgi:hypothetical protein
MNKMSLDSSCEKKSSSMSEPFVQRHVGGEILAKKIAWMDMRLAGVFATASQHQRRIRCPPDNNRGWSDQQ